MSFEFQGCLYPSRGYMLDVLAEEWITAHGHNSHRDEIKMVLQNTDQHIAEECIQLWGLDQRIDDGFGNTQPSHMEKNRYTVEDLVEAIARFREKFNNRGDED